MDVIPLAAGELEIWAHSGRNELAFHVRQEGADEDEAEESAAQLMKDLSGSTREGSAGQAKAGSRKGKGEGTPEEQAAAMRQRLAAALAQSTVEEQAKREAAPLRTVQLRQSQAGGLGMVNAGHTFGQKTRGNQGRTFSEI